MQQPSNELKNQITTIVKENHPNSISNRLNNQLRIFQRLKRIKKNYITHHQEIHKTQIEFFSF